MSRKKLAGRELTCVQSEQRVHAELTGIGLAVCVRTVGKEIVLVQVQLATETGIRAQGSGKGYPQQARLGALYEALEHYWSDLFFQTSAHNMPATYFAQTALFHDDSVLQFLGRQPDAQVACRTFISAAQQSAFSYPMALTSPNLPLHESADCRVLRRYSSNSGTAIGATYNEAVLHAANECIERDALSLFLLDHFYYENHPPLRVVARLAESDPLGRLWADAEREIGSSIVLIDISNEFIARTFLAFSTKNSFSSAYGTGCSLNPRHGAWRALTALVQLHHTASDSEHQHYQSNTQKHLRLFPRLLRCARFDAQTLLQKPLQDRVTLPAASAERPLCEQIGQLEKDLLDHGRTLGVCVLHRTALGTTLVNVVIPGLERFFTVSSGNVVVPQTRGRRRAPADQARPA